MKQWLASIVFTSTLFVSAALWGLAALLAAPFGRDAVYGVARAWARFILSLLACLCRLDYTVEGLERLPKSNTVILVKHSSAWETIAQLAIFPRQCWVLKRELLWAPILGWVLMLLRPIAINRGAGRSAVQQVLKKGTARIQEGLWVVIFPEGTRVPAGETRRYGLSGALLASALGRPVVPVAHNAGAFWPRRGLFKKAGTIRVVVGEPIATAGRDPREINEDVRRWIEGRLREMGPAR
jgi:1-acyl-sn-glycerol-3-phosphate acyltransferase